MPVMLLSCGNAVQPPSEADERASGPVDVPDSVQQPAPAAQRPGIGQMADRLLHQRPQPRLQAVERPLLVAEAIFGAPVADRRMPVLPTLGHTAEPPGPHARDLGAVQHPVQPRQLHQLLLVAAAQPAPVHASPTSAISASHSPSWSTVVMNVPSGWQNPRQPSGPRSRSRLSPTSVLEMPTARP